MKKRFKLYLLFVLLASLVLTAFVPQTAAGEMAEAVRPEKIDPALWDVLLAADEETLIPIDISLYDLDENTLSEKVELETGLDPEVFRDEARFEKEIASKLRTAAQTAFREETSYKASAKRLSDQAFAKLKTALSDDWGQWIDDASLEDIREIEPEKIVDRLILEIRSEFQFKQNEILRAEQFAANYAFVTEHVQARGNRVLHIRNYFASILVEAKKADILYYAQRGEVAAIFYTPVYQAEDALNHISNQVGADSVLGTKSINFNDGKGFKGEGISIGILEAGGVIDTSSPHYDQSRMTSVPNGSEQLVVSTHASLVTAIAAGERVGYNGVVYTGIVPEAKVYITRASNFSTFVDGLDALAAQGVNVINISLGFRNTASYTSIDRDLDRFINRTGITCVVAAGNNAGGYGDGTTYINSPGYAMNCITVGNLRTKSSGSSKIGVTPYTIHSSSSWEEPNSLPSEPDISAPGTWVRAVRTTTGTNPFYFDLEGEEPTGTSYAAPVVTGIVAQMMEEHSAKIGNPQAVKAKIMNTASPSLVSNANNGTESNPYLRDLSGAGMVNAVKAMSGTAYKYAWNHSAVEPDYITQSTITLAAGQKIRATLAFTNKNTDVIIQNGTQYYDMNLRLVDAATGAVLSAAEESRNNVEIVEYTASNACTVYVQTRIASGVSGVSTNWALEIDRY